MNYCPACRRHLNGALACAGCGTPAQYLMPAAPAAPDVTAAPYVPYGAEDVPAQHSTLADVYADSLVVLSGPGERSPGARRRVAHRRRRRTLLTIGLGLVLAAGGSLAVARMAADGEASDRAATVVLTDDAAPQKPVPAPDAPTSGAPAGKGAAKASGSAKPGAGATKSAGAGSASPAVTQPGPSASASASAPGPSGSVSASPGPGGTTGPTVSGQPSPTGPGGVQPPPPAPPKPTPTPTPTKSCVLWIFCG
ncbi:SCO2400 family protein [Streptomyces xanthophaeus]